MPRREKCEKAHRKKYIVLDKKTLVLGMLTQFTNNRSVELPFSSKSYLLFFCHYAIIYKGYWECAQNSIRKPEVIQ